MVFIERLAIQDRLDRLPIVVGSRLAVPFREHVDVAVLTHVEIKPFLPVKPRRGPVAAGRMKSDEVGAAIALAQSARHATHDLLMPFALDGSIAAQDPDHAGIPVPSP
jgi:hypothetical protein